MSITVGQLKKLIKKLPNSMAVVLGIEDSLENICSENIEVIKVKFTDTKDEYEYLFVLPICNCEEDTEVGCTTLNPELN